MAVFRWSIRRSRTDDCWLTRMLACKPRRVVAVALANRMARIVWWLIMKREIHRAPALESAGECGTARVAVGDAGRSENRQGQTVDETGSGKPAFNEERSSSIKRLGLGPRISMRARGVGHAASRGRAYDCGATNKMRTVLSQIVAP